MAVNFDEHLDEHYDQVVRAMMGGYLVPFLGAGANMCDRPRSGEWKPKESVFLPSSGELSSFLASEFSFHGKNREDLIRVSQYASIMSGRKPLDMELHGVFVPKTVSYLPNRVHKFLAELPSLLKQLGCEDPYQLIVTTNYDTLTEEAFKAAGEKYHLVTYNARGRLSQKKFQHFLPDSNKPISIDKPNEYRDLPIDQARNSPRINQTIILKVHGTVRNSLDESSFVITEDDYIEYLSLISPNISKLLPTTLVNKLLNSSKLFLGYSLKDWNMRAILHQIWKEQMIRGDFASWAIQLNAEKIDKKSWDKRSVEILNVSLEKYVEGLKSRLLLANRGGGN